MRKRALKKKDKNRFEFLQSTVTDALKELEKKKDSEHYDNIKLSLEKMKNDFEKYGLLIAGNSPRIGVFGCQNAGKSTLLNTLLGVDFLPQSVFAGTTRDGIELHNKEPENIEKPYKITVEYESRPPRIDYHTPNNAKDFLEIISKEKVNLENPDISRIKVEGPFESYIGDDIVLVDTPGVVELKADTEVLEEKYKRDNDRALAVLDKIDVIIFCMRYGYNSDEDKFFYNKYLAPKEIGTINVINLEYDSDKGTKRRSGEKELNNEEIKKDVKKGYGLLTGNTVVFSCQKALDIINENANKNINKIIKAEFKDKDEDLKEFKELKVKILDSTGIKDAEAIKERIRRYEERYNAFLKHSFEKNGIKFPRLDESWKTSQKILIGGGYIFGAIGKFFIKTVEAVGWVLLKILKIVKWIIIISLILLVILVILVILGAWSSWLI